jgi:FKBP-type peptidyl-prolyl cis-trans isomerase
MNYFKTNILTLSAIILLISSCGPNLESDTAKTSYAIGQRMGMNLSQQEIEIDVDSYILGLKDALGKKESRIPEAEMMAAVQRMSGKMQGKAGQMNTKNLEEGNTYLENNKKKAGVMVTKSGLQFRILKKGAGVMPKISDSVKVHYRGTTLDGKEFDSSYKRNMPAEFPLSGVIPGWQEGLQLMNAGSKFEFTIPSNLAYGPRGTNNIPGNSVLIFEVELLDVKKK